MIIFLPFASPLPSPLAQTLDVAEIARESERIIAQARTISGTFTLVRAAGAGKVDFALEKPYFFRQSSPAKVDLFDGAAHVIAYPTRGVFERRDFPRYGLPTIVAFEGFIDRASPEMKDVAPAPIYDTGTVVNLEGKPAILRRRSDIDFSLYIDPQTKLPLRWEWVLKGEKIIARFNDLKIDSPLPATTFSPAGVIAGLTEVPTAERARLLPVASAAPILTGTTLDGKPFDMTRQGGKRGTVLVFIDTKSPESAEALRTIALRRDKDVKIVAVTRESDAGAIRRFFQRAGITVPTLSGTAGAEATDLYGVALVPTIYLVDPQGTIRARGIGYAASGLKAAIPMLAP